MDVHAVNEIICPVCYASLPANVDACSECGASTRSTPQTAGVRDPRAESAADAAADSGVNASAPKGEASTKPPLLDRPWVVLGLLFFVMAILGLPVLWKSRGFSPISKVVLSIVVTLYTLLLFAIVGWICYWAYGNVADALR